MSQSAQAVEAKVAVTSYTMRGSRVVKLTFPPSSMSTQTKTFPFDPPTGTQVATIALQDFDLKYTNDNQFGFGTLAISLGTSRTEATCTVTLRDNNLNKRQWEGTVRGLVTFFG
jgi:hypothetical protein